MAVYTAYVACDTVGSTAQLPLLTGGIAAGPNTVFYEFAPVYNLYIGLVPFSIAGNCTSIEWHDYATNALECTWVPDGNVFPALPILNILFGPSGVPGTQGTSQDLNKFLFMYDDQFYGSNQGDMFCGWEGNDWFLLGKGSDSCYFAKGQDKDTYKKFNWKKDTLVLDTDVANKLDGGADAKLKDISVKYKGKKTVLKLGDGDKVVMKGKKAPDNFGQLKDCVDIQDWYV